MNKLLLTSDSFANPRIKGEFEKLIGGAKTKRVAIVTTAARDKELNKYAQLTYTQMQEIGFKQIVFCDFEKGEGKDLDNYDVVYVCGGNTFTLLKYAKQINFSEALKKLMKNGGLYVGVSAGSLIVGPSIEIANEVRPDNNDVGLKDFSGLNVTNHIIFPHYQTADESDLLKFESQHHTTVTRLANGEALLVLGKSERIIGK